MTTFTGTADDDLITPGAVSPGVTSDGAATPDDTPDFIDGGAGDDTIDGGGGNRDIVDGGAGSDLIINSEGTLAFGSEGADSIVGAFNDVAFGGQGDDVLTVGDSTRAFGEAGADIFIIPTEVNGAQMSGGDDADFFAASSGNFVIQGDAGDDRVVWAVADPHFSDSLIDGGDGRDTFTVLAPKDDTASYIRIGDEEGFDLVRVVRGYSDHKLYAQAMERINVKAGGGGDTIVVGDQTGLGAEEIGLDLGAGVAGGPDGQSDALMIEGSGGADEVTVDTAVVALVVSGLAARVAVTNIDHSEAATDRVLIATGDGDDTIDVSGAAAALSGVVSLDAGAGADVVRVAGGEAVPGVGRMDIDLGAAAGGGPDGEHDSLSLQATDGADRVVVATVDGELVVAGIPAIVAVHNLDHGGSVTDSVLLATGAGDDLIKMFALNDATLSGVMTVDTGAGDDVVIGGQAGFTLLFHAGDLSHDRLDFFRGAGNGGSDHIQLLGGPDQSFDELVASGRITEVGADVVITDGAGTFLTLTNIEIASLTASDFLFG